MPRNPPLRSNTPLMIVLVLTVLLLLGGAVGVFVWLESQPKVMASGHRWAVYPAASDGTADGSSSQESRSYGGNVKLLTLLYCEELTQGRGERIREALCHVLIDLPPEGVLQVAGGGSGGTGEIYRRLTFTSRGPDRSVGGAEKELEVRFDTNRRVLVLKERLLETRVNDRQGVEWVPIDKMTHGPMGAEGGNIFLVRLDENFDVAEVVPLNQTISTRLDDGTVVLLVKQASDD